MNRFKEQAMKIVFMVAACASVLAVFLICLFLFANGIPAIAKIGPLKFLLGTVWKPSNDKFGIFPMIIASIYVQVERFWLEFRSPYLLQYLWLAIVRKKSIVH